VLYPKILQVNLTVCSPLYLFDAERETEL